MKLTIKIIILILIINISQNVSSRVFEDDIFYQIMPISFRDSDGDGYGDFNGILEAIPYLQSLNVTAVWLNPIFSANTYHGYFYNNNLEVNPLFGTEQEFIQMVETFHANDIKIYIDLVAYGIGTEHTFFQDAYNNPNSQYDDWFAFTNQNNTEYFEWACFGYDNVWTHLCFWNLNNQDVIDYQVETLSHWLDPNEDGIFNDGIDGFRIDHLTVNNPDEAIWGYDMPYWNQLTSSLRNINPDIKFIAEDGNWGIINLTEPFDNGIDASFNTQLYYLDSFFPYSGFDLNFYTQWNYQNIQQNGQILGLIDNHDFDDRFMSLVNNDLDYAKLGAVWLFTSPFPPVIYYGEELGMKGIKVDWYGNDANDLHIREPFEWNSELSIPPHALWYDGYQEYIQNQFIQNNDGISVEEQDQDPESHLNFYRDLSSIRADNSALKVGNYHPLVTNNPEITSYYRISASQTVFVALNLSNLQITEYFNFSDMLGYHEREIFDIWDESNFPDIDLINVNNYEVTIQPKSFLLLEISEPVQLPFTIDGILDEQAELILYSENLQLWGKSYDNYLYIASTHAEMNNDVMILMSTNLNEMIDAPWAKNGQVANWGYFLANEGVNGWCGWFNESEGLVDNQQFFGAADQVLEGAIPLNYLNFTDSIYISLAEYSTEDNGALIDQLPQGNYDENIDFEEYFSFNLDNNVSSDYNIDISSNNISLNAFPNPFNPETTISYSIPEDSNVELSIYNIKGQKVRTLVKDSIEIGNHSIIWKGINDSGNPVSSGVYFYKLSVNGKTKAVKKCLMLK